MGKGMSEPWSVIVRLGELARGPRTLDLQPDDAQRAQIAREIGLISLPALQARVEVRPWLDGAELRGRIHARVEQVCGVTLDPFEQPLEAEFEVRAAPAGSPHAPVEGDEIVLDLEGPDPPDVLEDDAVDVAAYVIEHLALELDPFPRKPGARFDYEIEQPDDSPFGVLKRLSDPKG